jgi:2Fe-2S ferredoxin
MKKDIRISEPDERRFVMSLKCRYSAEEDWFPDGNPSMLEIPQFLQILKKIMPRITFLTLDRKSVVVENAIGTLMEIALENDIDGITGDCGGVGSCSTCHLYLSGEWFEKAGPPDSLENDTLGFNSHRRPNSRLGCQIEMAPALDGIVVEVAPQD